MTIEERLEKLEYLRAREDFWVSVMLVSILLLLAGRDVIREVFLKPKLATSVAEEVRANRFILVDAYGRYLAALNVEGRGPMLSFYGANGETYAALRVNRNGPILSLYHANGMPGADLAVSEDGPRMILADESGTPRARLGVAKAGPGMLLSDENGKHLWSAP
jgi:hypothetical protein